MLADAHRTVTLDRPWAPVDEQVGATIDALDANGLDRPVLIGHSAGAEIALATAIARPDRVRALVLIAPVVGRGAPRLAGAMARLPGSAKVGPAVMRAGSRFLGSVLRAASGDSSWVTSDVVDGYRRSILTPGATEAMWAMTAAGTGCAYLADAAADIDVPSLVVAGRADRWYTPVRVAGARTVLIDSCGHFPHEERPARVIEEIEAFLAELGQHGA